jgi:zinc finger CCHC domain-containing protein 9
LKRIAERSANKTCFACREVGHSAKDCPLLPEDANEASDGAKKTKTVVGICYRCAPRRSPSRSCVLRLMITRCGSRKHNLARCRQPARPDNPLPFASCFVCTGRGHLASSCPNNEGKGVYPNGGSCKLCGETTHLAKNCTLRKIGLCANKSPFPFLSPRRPLSIFSFLNLSIDEYLIICRGEYRYELIGHRSRRRR